MSGHAKRDLPVSIRESLVHFENRIKSRVCVRCITRSTMYRKAPVCQPKMA